MRGPAGAARPRPTASGCRWVGGSPRERGDAGPGPGPCPCPQGRGARHGAGCWGWRLLSVGRRPEGGRGAGGGLQGTRGHGGGSGGDRIHPGIFTGVNLAQSRNKFFSVLPRSSQISARRSPPQGKTAPQGERRGGKTPNRGEWGRFGVRGALTEGGAAARVVLVQVMLQRVPAATNAHHHVAPQHLGREGGCRQPQNPKNPPNPKKRQHGPQGVGGAPPDPKRRWRSGGEGKDKSRPRTGLGAPSPGVPNPDPFGVPPWKGPPRMGSQPPPSPKKEVGVLFLLARR